MVLPAHKTSEDNNTAAMGLRERKAQRTRQMILDSAWLLFTRDGVANTSVKSIAELAEVSEVTLYSYFKSRQLLIDEVTTQHASMERSINAIRERPASEGPLEVLRAIHQRQAELDPEEFTRQVKILRIVNGDPIMRGAYRRNLTSYVDQLVDALAPRADLVGMSRHRLEMLCYAFQGMIDALSDKEETLVSAQVWADATDEALVMLASGWGGTTP